MNIVFKTTASKTHGFGHLVRSINIANEMQCAGDNVKFQLVNPTREAIDLLKLHTIIECYNLPKETDIYVIDLPPYDGFQGIVDWLKSKTGKPIVVISDMKLLSNTKANLIIDTFDVDNIILHPYYAKYHGKEKAIYEKIKRVHLALGGYTEPERLKFFADALRGIIPGVEISCVPGFFQREKAGEIIPLAGINGHEVSKLMYDADLTICSPGITAAEAACCGTPALYYARNENQIRSATAWEWRGAGWAGLNMNYGNYFPINHIIESIGYISSDRVRKEMSMRGKEEVDGQGIYRAIKKIREVVR